MFCFTLISISLGWSQLPILDHFLNLTGRSCWVALSIQLQHEKKTTMIYRVNVPSKSCLIRFFSKDLQPRNPSSRLLYWTVQRDPRHFAVQGYQETSVTSGQLCIYIYIHVYNMLQVISSTWSCIKHLVKKQIFKERIGILEGTTHRIRNDLLSDLKSWLPPKKKNMCKPYNTFYFSALFSVFQACLLDTH